MAFLFIYFFLKIFLCFLKATNIHLKIELRPAQNTETNKRQLGTNILVQPLNTMGLLLQFGKK